MPRKRSNRDAAGRLLWCRWPRKPGRVFTAAECDQAVAESQAWRDGVAQLEQNMILNHKRKDPLWVIADALVSQRNQKAPKGQGKADQGKHDPVMLRVLDGDLAPYGLTALTVRAAIRRGELPEIRLGKQVLGVHVSALLAWIDARTVVSAVPTGPSQQKSNPIMTLLSTGRAVRG